MKFFIIHLIFINFIFSNDIIPPAHFSKWEILQPEPNYVAWTNYGKFQWCKAKSIIPAPIKKVQNIIENKKNYPNVFKRIEKIAINSNDEVHIILDMPFPFYGRDYIVKYSKIMEKNDVIYKFHAVKNTAIPKNDNYVRLVNAAGEWRLHSIDAQNTELIYIWNGELLGDFPEWALTQAWTTQGKEVMSWIKDAIK